jgi:mono/diheme cytochrome c family protein
MIGTIIGLLVLVALVVLFAWLVRRAWGAKRAWVKWPGVVLAGLLTLILALLTVVGASGLYKIYSPRSVTVPTVTVRGTSEQVKRGEYLAAVMCASCHSAKGELPLSGGNNLSADTGLPLGDIYGANLTPAGKLKEWADTDIFRLIRTGIAKDSRATTMAALMGARALSDEDALAVIAYLRTSPSVQGETPEFNPTLLTALFVGAGLIPWDTPSTISPVTAPPKGATADYGKYVLDFMDCSGCHGPKLDGNVPPPNPPAPDIRGFASALAKDQFFGLVRAKAAAAKPTDVMPWRFIAKLDDVELEALYLYLRGVTR